MNNKLENKVSQYLSEIYEILRILEVNKRDIFKTYIFLQSQIYDVPTDKKEEFELVMMQEMKILIDRFKRMRDVFYEFDVMFKKSADADLEMSLVDIALVKKLCESMDIKSQYLGSQVISDIEDEVYLLQLKARNGNEDIDVIMNEVDELGKLKEVIDDLVDKSFYVTSYLESFLEFDIVFDEEETV